MEIYFAIRLFYTCTLLLVLDNRNSFYLIKSRHFIPYGDSVGWPTRKTNPGIYPFLLIQATSKYPAKAVLVS